MPGLLVSVRDADEAALALAAGVEWIDVKEPLAGPLGAPSSETIAAVADRVTGGVGLSVACGELLDAQEPGELDPRVRLAKFGLAGCGDRPRWADLLEERLVRLPAGVRGVAVVYADWSAARAPTPRAILEAAIRVDCAALLVDTHGKGRGGLFDHLSVTELTRLISRARGAGLTSVLAGSLDRLTVPRALALEPDLVGVRGCVCAGGRTARLDPFKLAAVAVQVTRHSAGRTPVESPAPVVIR